MDRRQHEQTEKARSGSFGLFQDFQQLLQNVPAEASTAGGNDFTLRGSGHLPEQDETAYFLQPVRMQSMAQGSITSPTEFRKRTSQ